MLDILLYYLKYIILFDIISVFRLHLLIFQALILKKMLKNGKPTSLNTI